MIDSGVTRRHFVQSLSGIGSAFIAAKWSEILAAQRHAHRAAEADQVPFEFFSPEQGADVEAMTAQIIPTDDVPGAREARVVYFIDRALVTFNEAGQQAYTDGLGELTAQVRERFPVANRFADLSDERQVEVLRAIEPTPFFQTVRFETLVGFLADPKYGGNYGKIGWGVIGFDDRHAFQPPFGYYDRNYDAGR